MAVTLCVVEVPPLMPLLVLLRLFVLQYTKSPEILRQLRHWTTNNVYSSNNISGNNAIYHTDPPTLFNPIAVKGERDIEREKRD